MPTSTKKRKSLSSLSRPGSSLFDALSTLEKLEHDDVRAAKNRRRASTASVSKSLAAQAQTTLAGELIQCRILLQRALQTTLGEMSDAGNGEDVNDANERNEEEPTTRRGTDGKDDIARIDSADQLLIRLLESRNKLTKLWNAEADNVNYDGHLVGVMESSNDSNAPQCSPLDHILKSEYDDCRSEWKDTFNRRHHDLRLHSGLTAKAASKFRVIDQSFWNQVESAISHERLIQKDGSSNLDGNSVFDNSLVYMYDDSKIYQHMLRDFVALGASGGSSGKTSLAADAAAERLRRAKQKKKGLSAKDVDRKASKGRKIRYTVNPKLENFTFPVSRPVPSIGDDDWFRSLFGGAGMRKTTKRRNGYL